MRCNSLELPENGCRTVTIANLYSQPDLPTGVFHCQVSQIWRFSKAFGSENYRLALSDENHLATVFLSRGSMLK